MISMILAVSNDLAIGNTSRPDGLPWSHNKEDMKFFKDTTEGNVVVMGGNTFRQLQDIGFENGLPDRENIVMTRDTILLDSEDSDVWFYPFEDVQQILIKAPKDYFDDEFFIIGGRSIYEQLHPYCDRVYLTRISKTFPDADVKISLDFLSKFVIVDTKVLNDYSHVEVWERKK